MDGARWAVVSCHVERPLDDRAWARFSALQAARPGGFRIAALMRPPDAAAGEGEQRWLDRARQAATLGPLGHHTHFGGAARARPIGREGADAVVLREGVWLREHGLVATLFCGGGWYVDEAVAEAVAELGYADCTATAFRPRYLASGAPRLELSAPAYLRLAGGARLLELPTTHSLGMLLRAALRRRALDQPVVHAYFHDTDLLDARRRLALRAGLELLARRRRPTDLDELARRLEPGELPFSSALGR
jgi:hypothetical protein